MLRSEGAVGWSQPRTCKVLKETTAFLPPFCKSQRDFFRHPVYQPLREGNCESDFQWTNDEPADRQDPLLAASRVWNRPDSYWGLRASLRADGEGSETCSCASTSTGALLPTRLPEVSLVGIGRCLGGLHPQKAIRGRGGLEAHPLRRIVSQRRQRHRQASPRQSVKSTV